MKGLVAPMVESRFGLQKFLKCVNSLLPQDVVNSLQLGVNIETIQAYSNIHQILSIPEINTLNSITLGRVDFVSSMGETREYVNSNKIVLKTHNSFSNKFVPRVLGMTLKDAFYILENSNLKVIVNGNKAGKVETQSLAPGSKIDNNSTITIKLKS